MIMRQVLPILLLLAAALPAAAADWRSAGASEFTFAVTFEGEPLSGAFTDFDVNLSFDAANLDDAVLQVVVALAAADMGDPDMNAVLFDPAWFDVEQFAEATFVSTTISALEDGRYLATGTLDLKGNERPVEVPFDWQESETGATMLGSFNLRRTDFEVGDGEWATDDSIGLDVALDFTVRLRAQD